MTPVCVVPHVFHCATHCTKQVLTAETTLLVFIHLLLTFNLIQLFWGLFITELVSSTCQHTNRRRRRTHCSTRAQRTAPPVHNATLVITLQCVFTFGGVTNKHHGSMFWFKLDLAPSPGRRGLGHGSPSVSSRRSQCSHSSEHCCSSHDQPPSVPSEALKHPV